MGERLTGSAINDVGDWLGYPVDADVDYLSACGEDPTAVSARIDAALAKTTEETK